MLFIVCFLCMSCLYNYIYAKFNWAKAINIVLQRCAHRSLCLMFSLSPFKCLICVCRRNFTWMGQERCRRWERRSKDCCRSLNWTRYITSCICLALGWLLLEQMSAFAGVWPNRDVKIVDIIRMMIACTGLNVERTESIHNMMCKAFDLNVKTCLK